MAQASLNCHFFRLALRQYKTFSVSSERNDAVRQWIYYIHGMGIAISSIARAVDVSSPEAHWPVFPADERFHNLAGLMSAVAKSLQPHAKVGIAVAALSVCHAPVADRPLRIRLACGEGWDAPIPPD